VGPASGLVAQAPERLRALNECNHCCALRVGPNGQTLVNVDALPRILVVDDDDHVRRLLAAILERGYRCTLAACLDEGRAQLAKDEFGAVLCDVMLGRESGIALIGYVREHYPHTPIVMISALSSGALAHQTEALGAAGYVAKPFRHRDVLDQVAAAVGHRTQAPVTLTARLSLGER
jgi:DNA-binding NtrC family response regulator